MPEAPPHPHESARLASLRRTGILDTQPEAPFDEVVQLARMVCDAPTAFISFVDGARQWFKARANLEPHETPRYVSFCAHAILSEEGIVIEDATRDPRVAHNPLVTGPPYIRMYAGAPLVLSDGYPVGTLSVVDPRPRALAPRQWGALHMLARQVVTQIEVRMQRARLAEANAELRTREASLAALNAELDAYARTLSHDVRAPLRAVDAYLSLLRGELGEGVAPTARDFLDRAAAASRRAIQLADGVLELSRVSRAPLAVKEVDLSALARDVVDELRRTHPGRRVEAAVAPGLAVRADPCLARILLENLLANAWKFTGTREVAHVEVGRAPAGELYVRDDGVGFDPRAAARLFQPFERLHGRAFEGTGVGLATVRRIVERHGGTTRAESVPDRGTTVFFTLPAFVGAEPVHG